MLMHFQSPGDSCRNKKHGKMRNNLFRDTALLVAAVLLTTAFWSCSKSKEEAPEPTPPAVTVTGVSLNKTTLTLNIGASETLTATVAPADAANKKVTWMSGNEAVATVDANGKVTGVKAGEATITVTTEEGGKTATCKVTVEAATIAVTGVTLNKTELTLEVDGSETLTATVAPDDATNKEVTWSSDKPEIATVDAVGKVTGVATGVATITVTTEDGGKTATCKVNVKIPDIEGVVWFDDELAKTDIPEAMVFKDGSLLYYQYAKNDKAVSILKNETGKETIKKGDLVQKYTYSYTIVKNADGTSGTILSTGITMEYSKLTMNSVLMVVNGKNTLQCYTAEYLGFPINGVLQ